MENNNNNITIPVIYSCNDKHSTLALVSMTSIMENTKANIEFVVLYSELSEKTIEILNSIKKYENCNLNFIAADNNKIPEKFPILDYLIFKINDFVPDSNKAIYLKNSTLLNGDIQELYNYDVSNVLAAAVQDVWNTGSSKKIQLEDNYYFSCGVMLLNIENIKQADLYDKALEYQQNNSNMSEQDILNKIINNDKILISPRYNYMETWWTNYYNEYKYNCLREYEKAKKNPTIIHFTGFKPNHIHSLHSLREKWWYYAQKTPCYKEILENFKKDANVYVNKMHNEIGNFQKILNEIKEKTAPFA